MNRASFARIGAYNVMGKPIVAKGLSKDRVRGSVFRILGNNGLCSIATVTGDSRAHINTAYFCYSDQLELYFLSHPSSLHCRNLSTNSSMAMAIFPSSQKWADPGQGLQIVGTCRQARGFEARKAKQLYGKRFPAYASWSANLSRDNVARAYRFYRFLTSKLKILDEKEFGDGVFVYANVKRGPG